MAVEVVAEDHQEHEDFRCKLVVVQVEVLAWGVPIGIEDAEPDEETRDHELHAVDQVKFEETLGHREVLVDVYSV